MTIITLILLAAWTFLWLCLGFLLGEREARKDKKDDTDYISAFGALISLEERYEALLEALPQKSYSYAGTHPMWVVKAVEENTLNKETTMEDVADMVERCETLDDLKEELTDYFDLEEL